MAKRIKLDDTKPLKHDDDNPPPKQQQIIRQLREANQDQPNKWKNQIKTQLKPRHPPVKQKTRPIPYHLQRYVEKWKNKLNQSGHLEKYN